MLEQINVADDHGRTAIDHAIKMKTKSELEFENVLEILKILVQAGATYKSNAQWSIHM